MPRYKLITPDGHQSLAHTEPLTFLDITRLFQTMEAARLRVVLGGAYRVVEA